MSNSRPSTDSPMRHVPWRLPLALLIVLGVVFALKGWTTGNSSANQAKHPRPVIGKISLILQVEDAETAVLDQLPLREGMTVLGALRAAAAEDSRFAPQVEGQGERAFVHAIGGIENDGGPGRNWQFEVNGQLGEISCDAYVLRPDDHVLWKHAPYE